MKRFSVTLAYDVPCYCTVVIEAESGEEAEKLALEMEQNNTLYDRSSFEPEWSVAGETRIVGWEECDESGAPLLRA